MLPPFPRRPARPGGLPAAVAPAHEQPVRASSPARASVRGSIPSLGLWLGLLVAATAGPLFAQRSGTPIQPGLWELLLETRSSTMAGTGPKQPRQVTGVKACLGAAQAADPVTHLSDKILPPARGCTIASLRQSGPRVTWSIACPADVPARASASFEFASTRFTGNMRHEHANDPKKPEVTTFEVYAQRVGDC